MMYLGEDKKLYLDVKHPKNMVFIGEGGNLTGCYSGVHISPFWFQIHSQQFLYVFGGATVLIINGIPTV